MRRRTLILTTSVVVAAAVWLLTAGFGGGFSTTAATTPTQTQAGALAYARCMRSHGVPNFPDPSSRGDDKRAVVSALQAITNSQAQAAQTACMHINGGSPGTGQDVAESQAHTAAIQAFARCVRSHGLPNFPDPTSRGQLTPQMVASAGIDLHQPSVLKAGLACTGVTHGVLTRAAIERAVNGG